MEVDLKLSKLPTFKIRPLKRSRGMGDDTETKFKGGLLIGANLSFI